jgi:hypothetical protein
MTKHQRIVELRRALKDGVSLEYHYEATPMQTGGWATAPAKTTSADIKRHPDLYRVTALQKSQ